MFALNFVDAASVLDEAKTGLLI